MVSLPGFPNLTQEQREILETCPSSEIAGKGQLTRITAAAGAGKTTTLLALAVKAVALGHRHITYVTFTKAAATDGKERLQKVLMNKNAVIDARTLHSCAFQNLKSHIAGKSVEEAKAQMWSEKKIKHWIKHHCSNDITRFLTHLDRGREESRERERIAREQVEFFIFKSLVHFCQNEWSLEEYMNGNPFGRDYYPAKIFHQPRQRGEKYGFDPRRYGSQVGFYGDQAGKLFEIAVQEDILCFDFVMKRAQLLRLRVPGSLLLVDESQDMDACQVDWIAKQQVFFGTNVYVVGDPAQAIYGFRGAKPRYLMGLRSDIDKMLTESWRFGLAISKIANLVLYVKEKSDQTARANNGSYKSWIPYRTRPGILDKESLVTTKSLIDDWRDTKVTAIARQNASLLLVALGAMGFVFEDQESEGRDQENDETVEVEENVDPIEIEVEERHNGATAIVTPDFDDLEETSSQPATMPKIHINGRGEGSGLSLWRRSLKLISSVYDLYAARPSSSIQLDPSLFPEFVNRTVSWYSFCDECSDKELTQYCNVVNVVNTCKDRTMEAVEMFRQHVMDRHYSAQESDIILSTCHSAKGMEWDNVQVFNDFKDLCSFEKKFSTSQVNVFALRNDSESNPNKKARFDDSWQFGFPGWVDDLNLAYVACTRAKQKLSVPPCIYNVLKTLDVVYRWQNERGENAQNAALFIQGYNKPLNGEDVDRFFHCLVDPLRRECGVVGTDLLSRTLVEFENNDAE